MATTSKRGPRTSETDGDSERATYVVDAITRRRLRVLGEDNESQGVRLASRIAYDLYQRNRVSLAQTETPQIDLLVEHLHTGNALSQAAAVRLAEMRSLLIDVRAGVPVADLETRLKMVLL